MLLLPLLLFTVLSGEAAASCSLLRPTQAGDGQPQIGLIFVPGAQIAGAAYLPLLQQIQAAFPGHLWAAATTEWLGEMPNPIQIGSQLNTCLVLAQEAGLSTEHVFFAGHSLGGIVLESYIASHAELAQGIVLLGTWLPDLLRADNEFPVPVLTAIGELDGGGISYLRREWEETKALTEVQRLFTKTILVPQVNHGQVASGTMPESVVDNDIDGELTEEEAHRNYAVRVADWLVLNSGLLLPEDDLSAALARFAGYEAETVHFLQPFFAMLELEQLEEGSTSPFLIKTQLALMDVAVSDNLEVVDRIVNNLPVFQASQPFIQNDPQTGMVTVTTYSHLLYDLDILDFNNHLSASTVMAKMKSADSIYAALGLEPTGYLRPCYALNQMSLELAMAAASPTALNRMLARGRNLTLGEDQVMGWGGLAWEYGSLEWTTLPDGTIQLTSARLTSDVDFPLFPGLHYCHLISPYRALEWIYIESIRHVMHF